MMLKESKTDRITNKVRRGTLAVVTPWLVVLAVGEAESALDVVLLLCADGAVYD